ncbi:MAG: hypothetical protein HY754_11515 [Nitrospirae bacterium]|nr:hypothetical protein [Nitrospirota bacterium]
MKKLTKKLEDIFAAVSFAEAGEFDTAREILAEKDGHVKVTDKKIDRSRPLTLIPEKN